jgi:hypothetical protein
MGHVLRPQTPPDKVEPGGPIVFENAPNDTNLHWAKAIHEIPADINTKSILEKSLPLLGAKLEVATVRTLFVPPNFLYAYMAFTSEFERNEFVKKQYVLDDIVITFTASASFDLDLVSKLNVRILFTPKNTSTTTVLTALAGRFEQLDFNQLHLYRRKKLGTTCHVTVSTESLAEALLKIKFIRIKDSTCPIVPGTFTEKILNDEHAMILKPVPRNITPIFIDRILRSYPISVAFWKRDMHNREPTDAIRVYFLKPTAQTTTWTDLQAGGVKMSFVNCTAANYQHSPNNIEDCEMGTDSKETFVAPIIQGISSVTDQGIEQCFYTSQLQSPRRYKRVNTGALQKSGNLSMAQVLHSRQDLSQSNMTALMTAGFSKMAATMAQNQEETKKELYILQGNQTAIRNEVQSHTQRLAQLEVMFVETVLESKKDFHGAGGDVEMTSANLPSQTSQNQQEARARITQAQSTISNYFRQ